MMRKDMLGKRTGDPLTPFRANYKGVLMGNQGYTAEEAAADVGGGKIDCVAFGTAYVMTPDVVERITKGVAFTNEGSPWATAYGGFGPDNAEEDAKGYTDCAYME